MGIVLASASPRREELLRQVGCDFRIVVSDVVEDNDQALPPAELAMQQARDKALAVAARCAPEDVIVGADTIVVLKGKVFGKPRDTTDARRMLSELAGVRHHVITGVAVVQKGEAYLDFAETEVRIRQLSAAEIDRYIATGEPMGKAGAYAIQGVGSLLVEGIIGCYPNVVGLPLVTLDRLMRQSTGVGLYERCGQGSDNQRTARG